MAAKDTAVSALRDLAAHCSFYSVQGSIPRRNARVGRSSAALGVVDLAEIGAAVPPAVLASADVTTKGYAALTALANYFNTLYVPSEGSTEPGTGTEAQAIVAVRDFMAALAAAGLAGSVPTAAMRHGRSSAALVALDVAAVQAASNTSVAGSSAGNAGATEVVQRLKLYADTLYELQGGP